MSLRRSRLLSQLVNKRSLALPIQIYNTRIIWRRSRVRRGRYFRYLKKRRAKWLPYDKYRLKKTLKSTRDAIYYNVHPYYSDLVLDSYKHVPASGSVVRKRKTFSTASPARFRQSRITNNRLTSWFTAYKGLLRYVLSIYAISDKAKHRMLKEYTTRLYKQRKVSTVSVFLGIRRYNVVQLLTDINNLFVSSKIVRMYSKYVRFLRSLYHTLTLTQRTLPQTSNKDTRIGRLFDTYVKVRDLTIRKRRYIENAKILNSRYSTMMLSDVSMRFFLQKPSFFSNLYYYSTKIKTIVNICLLLCLDTDITGIVHKNRKRNVFLNLFFFRNAYFSEFGKGLLVYSRRSVKLLPFLLFSQCRIKKSIARLNIKNKILFFFFKFMYFEFVYSFLYKLKATKTFLSDTFFFVVLGCVTSTRLRLLVKKLVHKQSLLISFITFLSGYTRSLPSRLLCVLHLTTQHNSVFFLFWVLQRYSWLSTKLRLNTLLHKTLFFLLYKYARHKEIVSNNLVFFFFRLFALSRSVFLLSAPLAIRNSQYYVLTSFLFNTQLDTFRICNAAIHFFFDIFRIRRKKLRKFLFLYAVKFFTYQIEYTFFSYTKVPYFFFAKYYYKTIPPITNARLLCNYILIKLALGCKLKAVFHNVYAWQTYWTKKIAKNYVAYKTSQALDLGEFFYPVKGIRIVCSGPSYKARRTTALKYHMWVSDEYLTGKMPLSTMNLQIEYVQSYVVLRRSNIGIKVWLLLDDKL